MGDSKTNEELTSTMGNFMSTNKDDKNDASDSTPTSSTDAFTTTSTSQIVADDPISSTSSDVSESKKTPEKVYDNTQETADVINNPIVSGLREIENNPSPIVSEKDLLDMNITDKASEQITENVDDIVQDLENLLGEPTTSFEYKIKHKDTNDSDLPQNRNISADIDAFSAELERLEEASKAEVVRNTSDVEKTTETQEIADVNISSIEKFDNKQIENCQFEIISGSNENADVISVEKHEVSEAQDVTSTFSKSDGPEESLETKSESVSDNIEEKQVIGADAADNRIDENLPVDEKNECPVIDSSQVGAGESMEVETSSEESTKMNEDRFEQPVISSEEIQNVEEQSATIIISDTVVSENQQKSTGSEGISEIPAENVSEKTVEPEIVENKENDEIVDCKNGLETENPPEVTDSHESTLHIQNVLEMKNLSQTENISEFTELKTEIESDSVSHKIQESKSALPVEEVFENESKIEENPIADALLPESADDQNFEKQTEIPELQATIPKSDNVEMVSIPSEAAESQIIPKSDDIPTEAESIEEKPTESQTIPIEMVPIPSEAENIKGKPEELQIIPKLDDVEIAPIPSEPENIEESQTIPIEMVPIPSEAENIERKPEELQIIPKLDDVEMAPIPSEPENIEESQTIPIEIIPIPSEAENIERKPEELQIIPKSDDVEMAPIPSEPENIEESQTISIEMLPIPSETENIIEQQSEEIRMIQISSEAENIGEKPEELQHQLQEEEELEKQESAINVESNTLKEIVENLIENEIEESDKIGNLEANIEIPNLDVAVENVPEIANVDAISHSLADDLDLLVQNAVRETPESILPSSVIEPSLAFEEQTEKNDLNEAPLAVVPDFDVLNAISTLNDENEKAVSGIPEGNDLLEQSSNEIPIESALPILENPEQRDENLETLLAVASLQSVDYNLPPVEDFPDKSSEVLLTEVDKTLKAEQNQATVQLEAQMSRTESSVQNIPTPETKLNEPLVINIEESDKERVYSPKITIKPIKPPDEDLEAVSTISSESESKGSLKMTITKQSDNTHSILKIYDPNDDQMDQPQLEPSVPKLIIKSIVQPNEQPQSPKTSRSSKQVFSPSSSSQRSASPRITIKPIPKPEEQVAPLKITIKPVLKSDENHKQKHSPKLTIKPIIKPEDECNPEPKVHSPRVTIKPIVKPPEEEQIPSPRITIKPIIKPTENVLEQTPRVTIKPVVKPQEKEKNIEMDVERSSPKITIKPIVKPQEVEPPEEVDDSIKERIVLKINKGTIPGSSKDCRKFDEEKLTKIKLKFSKEGGHPQIVQDQFSVKRSFEQTDSGDRNKRPRLDSELLPGVTITPICSGTHSKLKEILSNKVVNVDDDDDDVTIVEETNKSSPIVISEESNQDSMNPVGDMRDPISEIPVFEITPDSVKTLNPPPVEAPIVLPAPRKRGRPRKVPLQVREDFKDPKDEEPKPVIIESTRPKRSCRGQSVRTTLGIKPRKPRGPGRGRGSKRGMGTRSIPPEMSPKATKELRLGGGRLRELKEDTFLLSDKSEIDDGYQKSPSNSLLAPPQSDNGTTDRADIVMYEEETRMSAETSSRAQTPAKQVVTSIPTVDLVEESQSSVQSTATTESVKVRRGPRLEVHQEPEGAVISADQLAEYYWMGGGPYMLQEQVAQFLGIKSFKRKYPNIPRRVVDMQERDFIRESGLAGEAMCDLGLTAVNSSDILDIMYSDFQDKYEEYCKHQRDRQAKDLINKQRALTLAASQEKAKLDITQQAVQSAANWNITFNKARKEQRKSCMDLQTLTIHYPKGKMKQINKPKIGHYPVALVPGQFTDYYREFTPTELNNLPLNTLCYNRIFRGGHNEMDCDSQTDGSGSESDTSTSDSDSSYSGSSDAEDCTLCKPTPKRLAVAQ